MRERAQRFSDIPDTQKRHGEICEALKRQGPYGHPVAGLLKPRHFLTPTFTPTAINPCITRSDKPQGKTQQIQGFPELNATRTHCIKQTLTNSNPGFSAKPPGWAVFYVMGCIVQRPAGSIYTKREQDIFLMEHIGAGFPVIPTLFPPHSWLIWRYNAVRKRGRNSERPLIDNFLKRMYS